MNKKYRILFLYHSDSNWYNQEYLYWECVKDPDLEVEVAIVPQLNDLNVTRPHVVMKPETEKMLLRSGLLNKADIQDWKELKITYPEYDILVEHKIPFIFGREIDWEASKYDVVVFGYPYEEVLYPAFRMQEIRKHVKKIVYIPYGIDIACGPILTKQSYYQPIHGVADAMFYPSESAKQKFIAARPEAEPRIYPTSTPRFDRLYHIHEREIPEALKKRIDNRYCVLVNHHFSFHVNRWSTLDFTFGPLFDFFMEHQDTVACIWRPHPNIERTFAETGMFSKTRTREILEVVNESGIIVDTSMNHIDAFAASDCFVTDVSSMFIEYIGTGKPMILQLNPEGYQAYDRFDKELMDLYYQTTAAEDSIAILQNLLEGIDTKKALRLLAKKKFVTQFDGNASKRIRDVMKELVANA